LSHSLIQTVPPPLLLIVDDTPDNLLLLSNVLKDSYRLRAANSGAKSLELAVMEPMPDLILLDVMMPVMDGYEVCRRLKADPHTTHIPVIFLTARAEIEDEALGLEMGAVDYITKPISPPILLARVKTHLLLKATTDFLRDKTSYLETEVVKRTRQVLAIQDATVLAMASLAETRDTDTGNHLRRTQFYIKLLAEKLKHYPRFSSILDDRYILNLFKSAPLHDIGKVGIPDRILHKPDKLTADEFEIMKTHAQLGRDAIQHAEDSLGHEIDVLTFAKDIAFGHHEKWDGSGYPRSLKGDAIPLAARLMAIADVYDALISRRVYKEPMPHELALAIIARGRGTSFDPDICDAFTASSDEFYAIALRYRDSCRDIQHKQEQLALSARS
jgi:putative two-component system response regulator